MNSILRFRWQAVAVAWIVCLAGWWALYLIPDRYQATALVRIESDGILAGASVASAQSPAQRLAQLRQALFTHDVLRRVVTMTAQAGPPSAATPSGLAEAIQDLSQRIDLLPGPREESVTVQFRDTNAAGALQGLQVLLTVLTDMYRPAETAVEAVIAPAADGNARRRELDAIVADTAGKLALAEAAVARYKPLDAPRTGVTADALSAHAEEYVALAAGIRTELKGAEASRDELRKRIAGEREWLVREIPATPEPEAAAEPPPSPDLGQDPEIEARIKAVRESLEQMRIKYTEEHPDVVSARRVLELLIDQRERRQEQARHAEEERRAQRERNAKAAKAARERAPPIQTRERNPVYERLQVALSQQEATVAALRAKLAEYERGAGAAREQRGRTPQPDTELATLVRAVEQARLAHEEALVRRDAAARAPRAAVASASPVASPAAAAREPIRLIEPPRSEVVKAVAGRTTLASAVLLVGVLCGVAAAYMLARMRPVFHDSRSLGKIVGLPVLGSVSRMSDKRTGVRHFGAGLAYTAACVGLLGCYAAALSILAHGVRGPI